MIDTPKKLGRVRELMRDAKIDAWIVNGSDPHLSEYVAARWKTRAWLTGFTGSAGTVVVTADRALLWVDSRYHIQGAQQIEGSDIELMRLEIPGVPDHMRWLAENLGANSRVGIDGTCTTVLAYRTLKESLGPCSIEVVELPDWFDRIWEDRPAVPTSKVTRMDDATAGASAQEKVRRIRDSLRELGCSHTIVSSLDDIAWILNLRGSDIPFNPVFLSYLVITSQEVFLFTDPSRFGIPLPKDLSSEIMIRPYDQFFDALDQLFQKGDVLYYAPDRTTVRTRAAIPPSIAVLEGKDLSSLMKAKKSPVEIEGMRRAHLLDGIAMVKLLASLARTKETLTELGIASKLQDLRSESEEYLGPSFSPIAGFGAHGALAHYSATEESSVELTGTNLLVLDTGGQYRTGTTDITRTLLFGEPTEQMRADYTLVLKGNLALAAQRFPSGTYGYQLDVLARQFLWQALCSYGHGTGHGIGFCLNVHEGPQNISPKPVTVPIEEGMIISDEPGLYREGFYGIRIENLIVAQHEAESPFGRFLAFDVLTLCPFERRLIDTELLSERERQMIDAYHGWVYMELRDFLSAEDEQWLREATLPL